jgi:thiamine kinase-like enzyme
VTSGQAPVRAPRTAAALTDADLEAILDLVPCLVGRTGETHRVPGGLTNVNVRVELPDGPVIARIATDDSAFLAIDRDAEYRNCLAAARSGAAPDVVGYSPQAGVLVVRWVDGHTLTAREVGDPANLTRVAHSCRRLHAGPRFVGDFDMFEVQRRYLDIVQANGFRLPERYLDLMPAFARVEAAARVRAGHTVPCNNDLLAGNFVDDGAQVWLIDFEYAGNNDACFELGNIWSESSLPDDALEVLVTAYLGRHVHHEVARARLLGLASAYGWTLWAAIQHAVSSIEFDYWAWGMEKYERAAAELASPQLEHLLGEAIRPD